MLLKKKKSIIELLQVVVVVVVGDCGATEGWESSQQQKL